MSDRLNQFEERIGYQFSRQDLLRQALTHSSYTNEHQMGRNSCNERIEFLGDAVLELASSEFIFSQFPQMPEGEMTKLRASIVCEPTLAICAKELGVGDLLFLGKGEQATGGRFRDSILSDALESIIGAIYLDGGFTSAKEFICRFILNDIEHKKLFFDSKTILQEKVQSLGLGELHYELLGSEGPDHCKTFTAQVRIQGEPRGIGCGRTKKFAEHQAAYQTILEMKAGR